MEAYNVIVGFFKNGGVFMIPIVVILASARRSRWNAGCS
jgi:hypothetical protein